MAATILSPACNFSCRRADNSPVIGTLGFQEILLICFVALVVVGPRQLVAVAGKLGRLYGELKRKLHEAQASVQKQIDDATEIEALKRIEEENRRIMIATGVLDAQGNPQPAESILGPGSPVTNAEDEPVGKKSS